MLLGPVKLLFLHTKSLVFKLAEAANIQHHIQTL
jgi:hypothetical protein